MVFKTGTIKGSKKGWVLDFSQFLIGFDRFF